MRFFGPVVLVAAVAASTLFAGDPDSVARGKYLVDEVGQCGACHTPRDADGKPDASKHLKGAVLNFQPIEPVKGWHKTSPDITSTGRLFTRWKDEGMVKFLETGSGPSGNAADAPMPTYKLSHADAQAIVDYLKSIK